MLAKLKMLLSNKKVVAAAIGLLAAILEALGVTNMLGLLGL